MKAVISWIATVNDYRNGQVNTEGPNHNLHRHFYKYQKHFLLTTTSPKSDAKTRTLIQSLQTDTGHSIEHVHLAIQNVTDIKEVYYTTLEFLISKRDYELEVFISPGTPTMQVAWYLIKLNQSARITLFQIAEPKHTSTEKHEIRYVDVESNSVTTGLLFKEHNEKSKKQSNNQLDYVIFEPNIKVFNLASKIALSHNSSVLITGETGTGKGMLARHIHIKSAREKMPFFKVNCAGLNDELLASQLFGHEKGAFTGATTRTDGYFSAANGGTIFLDEIGDISRKMQSTILEVLEDKQVMRVGSTEKRKVDVRVIAATHRDLLALASNNEFRFDLYYRLAVAEIELPSVKNFTIIQKRAYVDYFIDKKANEFSRTAITLKNELLDILTSYHYPGNLREMENMIEAMYVYSNGNIVGIDVLPSRILKNSQHGQTLKLEEAVQNHIIHVLYLCDGNVSKASKILDVSPNTLKKYRDKKAP